MKLGFWAGFGVMLGGLSDPPLGGAMLGLEDDPPKPGVGLLPEGSLNPGLGEEVLGVLPEGLSDPPLGGATLGLEDDPPKPGVALLPEGSLNPGFGEGTLGPVPGLPPVEGDWGCSEGGVEGRVGATTLGFAGCEPVTPGFPPVVGPCPMPGLGEGMPPVPGCEPGVGAIVFGPPGGVGWVLPGVVKPPFPGSGPPLAGSGPPFAPGAVPFPIIGATAEAWGGFGLVLRGIIWGWPFPPPVGDDILFVTAGAGTLAIGAGALGLMVLTLLWIDFAFTIVTCLAAAWFELIRLTTAWFGFAVTAAFVKLYFALLFV